MHFDGLSLLLIIVSAWVGYTWGTRRQARRNRSRLANDAETVARARESAGARVGRFFTGDKDSD